MVDINRCIIFIHVAKTGGSAIQDYYAKCAYPSVNEEFDSNGQISDISSKNADIALPLTWLQNDPHHYLKHAEDFLDLSRFVKFSVIRSPIEYVHSSYQYFRTHGTFSKEKEFIEFVESGRCEKLIPTQHEHYLLNNGEFGLDYLFPYEKIYLAFDFIKETFRKLFREHNHHEWRSKCRSIDEVEIEWLQPSNRDKEILRNDKIRELINEVYFEDFKYWQEALEKYKHR